MNLTLDTLLIIAAIICLVLLLVNVTARINLLALAGILFLITFLTGCAPQQLVGPYQHGEPASVTVGADLHSLATQAAEAYIKQKNGDADYAWSIAAGLRAYQTGVKTYSDVKKVVADFSEGKKAGLSLADRIARLFVSSPLPPAKKAEVIAAAVEKAAATK